MPNASARVVRISEARPKQGRPFGTVKCREGRGLFVRFYYLGQEVQKAVGLPDTPANREKVRAFLDAVGARIKDGTFRYDEAFPGAPEAEKLKFARLEGRVLSKSPGAVLLGEYVEEWRKKILSRTRSEWKERDYNSGLNTHILPYFEKKTFAEITGMELVAFVQTLSHLSPSRIRNVLIPLRIVWEDAVEEHQWDLRNPFEHLKRRNRDGELIPDKVKNPPEAFTYGECSQLLNVLSPWYRPIVELQFLTGMIASELERLDAVAALKAESFHIEGTKTEYRDREFPRTERVGAMLEELATRQQVWGKAVTLHTGRKFDASRFREEVWVPAVKAAGLNYRRPYATRHTFALWSLAAGVNMDRLVALMGHGSREMVYSVYGKYRKGVEKDAEEIRAFFGRDFL